MGDVYAYVMARNDKGYSRSSPASEGAWIPTYPDKPINPTTSVHSVDLIEISWTAPFDWGSPIFLYSVEIRNQQG